MWKNNGAQIVVVNVYSPRDMRSKKELWGDLKLKKTFIIVGHWCVIRDFNCIKSLGEHQVVVMRWRGEKPDNSTSS